AFGYTCKNIEPTATKFAQAYCSEAGQQAIRSKVQLLHCTTEYPCPYSEVNLAVIETMRLAFGLDIGFSDHTTGIVIPIAAVARGVRLIEKHFTLDKNFIGPDHKASLNPNELCEMIKSIRFVEMAIGNTVKVPTSSEIGNSRVARRSLCATSDIVKGELFNVNNLTVKRPGTGIEPMLYWDYFNKRADRDIKADELI
ncbi:MAG: N-acetylneuraminate synthase family protein, partial [Bacillota bacterium]